MKSVFCFISDACTRMHASTFTNYTPMCASTTHTIIPVRVIVRHNASGSEHLRWSGSVENWPCMCACERMHAHMHVYNLLLARAQRERERAREREKRRAKRERDLPLPSALGGSGACEIGTRTRDSVGGLAAVGARGFPPDARDGKGPLL